MFFNWLSPVNLLKVDSLYILAVNLLLANEQPVPQIQLKLWLSFSAKLCWNPCVFSVYKVLSMHYDEPVKKAIVNLPVRLKGNLKHISCKLLCLLVAQNKEISAASETLLTKVIRRLCLWHRLRDEQVDLSKGQLDLPQLHFCFYYSIIYD